MGTAGQGRGSLSLSPFLTYSTPPLPLTAPDASFRDLLLAIRKDEDTHREVNHTFANLKETDDNPFLVAEQYRADVTTLKTKAQKKE